MDKIPFTIKFPQTQYTKSEVYNFQVCVEGSPSSFPDQDQADRYIKFLQDFQNKKVKPTTLIDNDIFKLFLDDVKNRASIDYLESHYDEEEDPDIVNGGKYFYKKSQELERVYNKFSS